MGTSIFAQIKLLLWKNYVLQKRRPIGTFFEIALPCLFFLILASVRNTISSTNEPATSSCSAYSSPLDVPRPYFNASGACSPFGPSFTISKNNSAGYDTIAFVPDTPAVRSVMDIFEARLAVLNPTLGMSFVGFNTTEDIGLLVDNSLYNFMLVIVFQEDNGGSPGALGISGRKLHYSLRFPNDFVKVEDGWQTDLNFPDFETVDARTDDIYLQSQFVAIQSTMDLAIIQYLRNSTSFVPEFVARVKAFPYPEYISDTFIILIREMLPLLMVLSYLYTAISIVRALVHEKESRMRESMKMMGLSNWILWLCWFIKHVLFLSISVLIIVVILAGTEIFRYSNMGVLFAFLILFALSTIMLCFLISTFFDRASVAAAASGLLFFGMYGPYFYISIVYDTLSSTTKRGSCLLAPTCVGIGARIFSIFEARGDGVTPSTLTSAPSDTDDFAMSSVLGMLALDCLLYGILAWYIDAVFPGKYGVPKKPYFFLQKSYWTGSKSIENAREQPNAKASSQDFEEDPVGYEAGIRICNLRKEYGEKVAVEGLSLNMYEGQITALLGHNGAGKTTTMSMLVGLYAPTAGTAFIGDSNIVTDSLRARQSLGLCPQFDVLFETLTVEEHLYFFAQLKGATENLAQEVDQYVKDLDLEAKRHAFAGTLSGGQKRALSCAIALCGGSKYVILDEPTSGMDPFKRRQTWDVLLKHKKGRTILLTTHFMDEADVLCERIAILSDGKLRCVGSSSFLKSRFGAGYHLTLVKTASTRSAEITKTIKSFVPDASCVSDVGTELAYILPTEDLPAFPSLFQYFDDHLEAIGITGYGVGVTTLEDVFLKVGHSEHMLRAEHRVAEDKTPLRQMALTPLKGSGLLRAQFLAMFQKRWVSTKRGVSALISQFVLPMIFFAVALAVANLDNDIGSLPSRPLQLSGYYKSKAALASSRDLGFDQFSDAYLTPSTVQTLQAIGLGGETAPMHALKEALLEFNDQDPRMGTTVMHDVTGANMTAQYLGSMGDFQKNSYFKYNLVGTSFARGAYRFEADASTGNCMLVINGTLQAFAALNFAVGSYYDLQLLQSSPSSTFTISASSSDPFFQQVLAPEAGFTEGFTQLGETIHWQIDSARSGEQLFLHCSHQAGHSGSTLNIVPAGSPDTPPTGVVGFAWFNQQALHASAISLNVLSNAFAQTYVGSDAQIFTYNYPLPKSAKDKVEALQSSGIGINVAILALFGIGFLQASFAIFIVSERVSKAKHIQFVSGVRPWVYWLTSFLWDYGIVIVSACLSLIVIAAQTAPAYQGSNLGLVFLLFLLFGFAALPLIYVLSFWCESASTAYSKLCIFFIFGGIGMLVCVLVLGLPSIGLQSTAENLRILFCLHPGYAFAQGIFDIYLNYNYHEACLVSASAMESCRASGYIPVSYTSTSAPGIGAELLMLFGTGVAYFLALAFMENKSAITSFFSRMVSRKRNGVQLSPSSSSLSEIAEDEDVTAERNTVATLEPGQDGSLVLVKNLKKSYVTPTNANFLAVNGLSFQIPHGVCFGLLGVNGAGKSTTFSMLTGEIPPTEGEIYLNGFNVAAEVANARRHIGYCPQYDGLIDFMTAREHLVMFGRLRGIQAAELGEIVDDLLLKLGLLEYADRPSGGYSGGNKRKLSTAIALIGDPPVVFLDEPSSGMDPASRRFIWTTLQAVTQAGRSIVLTSHSMEEADALCHRLAIMVNGRFQALGSVQHLKSKFGNGYRLMAKVQTNDAGQPMGLADLKTHILERFPNAHINEEHYNEVVFDIRGLELPLAEMFTRLEAARRMFNLRDQSISQTTLEQVFLSFAKHQATENDPEPSHRQTQDEAASLVSVVSV
eukprot:m.893246 g.893246  ORF g.893246 m.893246 type:complete len:1835 (+) comp59976_c0_seq1:204-5708(+)